MNNLVLVSGIPASGKTSFAKYLADLRKWPLILKDEIKETVWDRVRYDTEDRAMAKLYGALAYDICWLFAERLMKSGVDFVFESNFTKDSEAVLFPLTEKYRYRAVTVMFDADIRVLHDRFMARDDTDERHPGLRSNGFYVNFAFFRDSVDNGGLRQFRVGEEIIMDTTDFLKVDYSRLLKEIDTALARLSEPIEN